MSEIAKITYEAVVEKWKKRQVDSVNVLDAVLSDYRILFAYHSNKIEHAGVSLHETREIFENGKVINYTGDLRALFETEDQKVCYDFLKDKIIAREPVTPKLILETHEKLCHGCYDEARWSQGERPGTWKKHFYGVGMDVGVSPEDVPEEINFICGQLAELTEREKAGDERSETEEPFTRKSGAEEAAAGVTKLTDDQIVTAASYFHCNLESIHPFADGNGRVGRTLLNYILMVNGLPPTVLFDEDKKLYYEALAVFDHSDRLDGFAAFVKEQTVKTWTRRKRNREMFIAL